MSPGEKSESVTFQVEVTSYLPGDWEHARGDEEKLEAWWGPLGRCCIMLHLLSYKHRLEIMGKDTKRRLKIEQPMVRDGPNPLGSTVY